MPIDNLVDEAIDEVIAKSEKNEDDLKKRRPKQPSFRYLTNDEIKEELEKAEFQMSVMKPASSPKIIANDVFKLGIGGDMQTVEDIIKRHQTSRKFR